MKLTSLLKSLIGITAEDDSVEKTATYTICDAEAMGEKNQPLTISIVDGDSPTVVAFWSSSLQQIFKKSEKSQDEANSTFLDLSTKAERIAAMVSNGLKDEAEKASKEFISDLKIASAPPAVPASTQAVESIEAVGTLSEGQFEFKESYLMALLRPIDICPALPNVFKVNAANLVYATHSKNHIGSSNFVAQWFPKILTKEGMVENMCSLEMNSAKGRTFFTVHDCDRTRFEKICRVLTPTYEDVGYELKQGSLRKKSEVTFMYFENPADAATYQKAVTPGAPAAPVVPATPALPKEIEEAGAALAGNEPGGAKDAPKGLAQAKMDAQDKELKSASLSEIGMLLSAAKKKKKEEVGKAFDVPSNPGVDATEAYSLSKWDEKVAPENPISAKAIYQVRFDADQGTFSLEMVHGWTTHLDRDTAMMYLKNEGYSHEDAQAHLDKALKGLVTLRKRAAISNDSSLRIKAALTRVLREAPMSSSQLLVKAHEIVQDEDEASIKNALADLRQKHVVETDDENPDSVHRLTRPNGGKIAEIARLLKSPARFSGFEKIVEGALAANAITDADYARFEVAASRIDSSENKEVNWMKLAEVANELFIKAKGVARGA